MKHYLEDDFIKKYINYLNKNEDDPYYDIDSVQAKDEIYYKDLTSFLNCVLGKNFISPKKEKYPFAIYERRNNMYYTSDTFGFSALCSKANAWNSKCNYPYAKYLEVSKECKVEDINKCKFVAECIYETRTIGGAFVWPKVLSGGKYQSTYNYKRGVKSYIDDRVDLTLYEIKCFYDIYCKYNRYDEFLTEYKNKYSKNVLINSIPPTEQKAVFDWLKRFVSFSGYIEKFCFTPFIKKVGEENYILNIDSEKKDEVLPIDYNNILHREDLLRIGEMNSKQIYVLLSNLVAFTKKRSILIENIINKNKHECDCNI